MVALATQRFVYQLASSAKEISKMRQSGNAATSSVATGKEKKASKVWFTIHPSFFMCMLSLLSLCQLYQ
jgi:hypothetical protein